MPCPFSIQQSACSFSPSPLCPPVACFPWEEKRCFGMYGGTRICLLFAVCHRELESTFLSIAFCSSRRILFSLLFQFHFFDICRWVTYILFKYTLLLSTDVLAHVLSFVSWNPLWLRILEAFVANERQYREHLEDTSLHYLVSETWN